MKSNTTKEYPYTGDLYPYVVITSADGSTTTREYNVVPQIVYMSLTINLLGELVIQSQTKMQLDAYIKNILDRNGEEIYTGGTWQIIQTAPILGPLGIKGGYRYRARLIEGMI
jgi:hypothetical protein